MSLKDELSKSKKLSPHLRMQIIRLDDATDPDTPLFSAIIKGGTGPLSIRGAEIHDIAGDIHTAHKITLNGLKNLVDDLSITYVEGSTPMFPAGNARPRPPSL